MPVRLVNSASHLGKYRTSSLEPPNFQTTSLAVPVAAGATCAVAAAVGCAAAAATDVGVVAAVVGFAAAAATVVGWAAGAGADVGAAGAAGAAGPQAASRLTPAVAMSPRNTNRRRLNGLPSLTTRYPFHSFHIWNLRFNCAHSHRTPRSWVCQPLPDASGSRTPHPAVPWASPDRDLSSAIGRTLTLPGRPRSAGHPLS